MPRLRNILNVDTGNQLVHWYFGLDYRKTSRVYFNHPGPQYISGPGAYLQNVTLFAE